MQEELSRTETEDSDSVANSLDENSWSDSNNVDGPMSVTVSLVCNKLARHPYFATAGSNIQSSKMPIQKTMNSVNKMRLLW